MKSEDATCTACPLYAGATKQLLSGTGPSPARIMLVGEAPGAREDELGAPFVGDAGAVLNRVLEKAGMQRADVFVTNSVRCRPPKNRKPTAKELNVCKQHLIREVNEVQPVLVIALGNYPLKALCGLSGITQYRSQTHEMHKSMTGHRCPVFATFHPAFALRYPEHEQEIIDDLLVAMRTLDGGFRDVETPWCFYRNGHRPAHDALLLSFDIETNARELHDPELRVWFGSIDDGEKIVMFVGEEELATYATLLRQAVTIGNAVVGHNSSAFDRAVLLERYGVNVKCDDTQLLAHLIDEAQSLKLQSLAVRYLGVRPWKGDFDAAFWRRGPQNQDEWKAAFDYNARDTRYTRLLFTELWERATPAQRHLYRSHNLPCSRALRTTERHGVYVSIPNTQAALGEIEVDQRLALLRLKEATNPDFNPGSHQQVRELLFDDLLLPPQKTTAGNEPSTNEETLKRLESMNLGGGLLKTILDYRENTKLLGTYLRPFLKYASQGPTPPYMYPSYSMTTTVTGRTSSYGNKDPLTGEKTATNLQNTPRDPRVRSCIAAPPGWAFVEADFSQIELRLPAEFAGPSCALYQEYCKPNPDVHRALAQRLVGRENVTKEERSRAKPWNFACLYQLFTIARRKGLDTWQTLQRLALTEYGLTLGRKECEEIQAAFGGWGLDPWYESVVTSLEAYGEITTLFGRTRHLPSIRSKDKYTQLEAMRQGVNFLVQSTASDIALLALAEVVGQGWWTCGYIHDAIQVLVPLERVPDARAAIQTALETTTPQLVERLFGYRFSLPLTADVSAGAHWGHDGTGLDLALTAL